MKTKLLIITALLSLSGCQTTKQAQQNESVGPVKPAEQTARGMTDDEMYEQAASDQAYQLGKTTVSQDDVDKFSKEFNKVFKPVQVDDQTLLSEMVAFPKERMIAIKYEIDVGPIGKLTPSKRLEFQSFIDESNVNTFCEDKLWREAFQWGFVAFLQYDVIGSGDLPLLQYLSERKCVRNGY